MVPFDSFAYFAVLLYVLPVTVALRLVSSTPRAAIVLTTIVMLAVQYGGVSAEVGGVLVGTSATVAAYAVYQWLLAAALAALARRRGATQTARPPRTASYLALTLALAPLVLVKFEPELDSLIGFLGMSYVTFRSLDVLFSIHDGVINRIPVLEFLAFLLCFPTISAGPIDRYRRFAADWRRPRDRGALVSDLDISLSWWFRDQVYMRFLLLATKRRWFGNRYLASYAGLVLSFGLMGNLARPARAVRPVWALPRCAAHRTRCLQARGAPHTQPRTLLAR